MKENRAINRTRFQRWVRLGGASLVTLVKSIEATIIPYLESEGFIHVDFVAGRSDWPVSGRELVLERVTENGIEVIIFDFDKYSRPIFQIRGYQYGALAPNEIIRAANLVKKPTQYYHFWGKSWWVPLRFWSEKRSLRCVTTLQAIAPQILDFFTDGTRGPNISLSIE